MRSAAAVLCAAVLSAATALQPGALQPGPRHLYISGVDASGTDAEVIAALGGESAVEDVALFADRGFGFATMATEASAAAALARGPRPPLFDVLERAKSAPRPRTGSARRTLESGSLRREAYALSRSGLEVIADGVKSPENAGALLRLAATLGARSVVHAHSDDSPPPRFATAGDALEKKMRAVARGCEKHVTVETAPRSALIAYLRSEDRAPVVALETASDAASLPDFAFPERCAILVGGEGLGIRAAVVRALRPEVGDAICSIPTVGPHASLNVATSLAIAMYEYRRRWPGS